MTVPVMQSPTEITQRLLTPGQAPFLGVVMLDTRFPRPVGDLGNLASYPVPDRAASGVVRVGGSGT